MRLILTLVSSMRYLTLILAVTASACAPSHTSLSPQPSIPEPSSDIGVLVMAHGGSDAWNENVEAAVLGLSQAVPTVVAFGMADPGSLRTALDTLRTKGVGRVAVVRMFLSGESFLDQTNYLLGMSDTAPETFVLMGPAARDPAAREPLKHEMTVVTHLDGLLTSDEARGVLSDRARALSSRPESESVLIIAHGMGDESANDRVLFAMEGAAESIRAQRFADVHVATLREDWPRLREKSEAELRDYVAQETASGRRVIVLPMRLAGFGPYAEVLAGLHYAPGDGLLPHDAIGSWVRNTAARVACSAGWGPLVEPCSTVLVEPATRRP